MFFKRLSTPVLTVFLAHPLVAQQPTVAANDLRTAALAPAAPAPLTSKSDAGIAPTWETQKQARTYILGIPAPRGQIVDRNGAPLAQTRVSYNLAITFPTPLTFAERDVVAFAQKQVMLAQTLTGRAIGVNAAGVAKHYKNRGVVPYVIAQDLSSGEIEGFKRAQPENLQLQPVYERFYPNGPLAGHILGYAGRGGKMADGPIQNNELLWPNAEGRDGLEQSFDDQLQGKIGQYNISFDAAGKRVSEEVAVPPQPGYNIVTSIDAHIQQLCEDALKTVKRGAMVFTDPNTGDVLAMASWPCFNPNSFVPNISASEFKALQDDPNIPLLPRAFRSSYPPGSIFKVFIGAAALQSGRVSAGDEFTCPPSMEIGGITFRNWKKTDAGSLNFADALTQSCDTWFYQVGMKIGPRLILDYAQQFGFGVRTGLPLAAEAGGLIPSDEFMLKTHKRRILNGDVANLSIGQGDTTVTPLQAAMAMGAVANGGTLYAARLVQQVQAIDNQIVNAYDVRARTLIDLDRPVVKELHRGMIGVVSAALGTAAKASVPGVVVAGKTGTAQWGPKDNERTAAWFAGFAPADQPKYAFAVVYEGDANDDSVHGGSSAAPLVGKVLRELFKDASQEKKAKKRRVKQRRDEDGTPVRRAEPVSPDAQ